MDSCNVKGQSDTEGRIDHGLHLACGSLMLIILALDLATPLGVAMAVPYIAVVLISLWSKHKRFTIIIAIIASMFTIGAFLWKPPVNEMWKVVSNRALALSAIWVTATLGLQRKIAEEDRDKALCEREMALKDIRILRGLLPICASCKKIRDDQGYWIQIEGYITAHSEADFTHGICPECMKKLYPQFYKQKYGDSDTDR